MTIERELLMGGEQLAAASANTPRTGTLHGGAGGDRLRGRSAGCRARAVDAAAAAFEPWAATPPVEKRQLFLAAADLLESRAKEAAESMTAETGAVGPGDVQRIPGHRNASGGGRRKGAAAKTLYPPTVLTGVLPQMRIETEEIFGPVCTVVVVDDEDEAIAVANASPYGLTAGVLTEDVRRGLGVARRLRTGIVHVNDQSVDDEPQAPFGGVGDSGYGRFGGRAALESFTELRWVTLQQGHHPFPF